MVISLPTPSTSHVSFDNVYEPAEDSFLLLDALSSPSETAFLQQRFPLTGHAPLVAEFGTGSGVVLAFVTAHASAIFGSPNVLTLGVDVNKKACAATRETVKYAQHDQRVSTEGLSKPATFLDAVQADLGSVFRTGSVDVIIFNPPYVPTEESPEEIRRLINEDGETQTSAHARFEADSRLLALSYAGGADGMETTDQFLEQLPRLLHPTRGVAYLLLCAGNHPDRVLAQIQSGPYNLDALVAGHSGKKAGRETLQILRIFKRADPG